MGPPKKKTNPAIPILIVVALIAVGVGAFVLLSGGDDSGDSPTSTVEAFFDAGQDRDCQAAGELLSSQAFESFGGQEAALQACEASLDQEGGVFSAEGAELVSTEATSEDDSSATVTAEVRTADGETTNQEFNLVKEDGEWKISGFGGTGSSPTPPGGGEGSGTDPGGGSTETSTPLTTPTTSPSDGGGSGSGGSLGAPGPIPSADPDSDSEDLQNAGACEGGDMVACDDLYWGTGVGTALETYGRTCGGRVGDESRPGGGCEQEFG